MATIKDIAKETGVSMMTISRAFNKPDQVSEELRQQIYDVAKKLNYSPNQAAKSLASNKTGIIQLVSSMDSKDFYFAQLFTGATQYLSEMGYSVMINKKSSLNYDCDGTIFMGLAYGEDISFMPKFKKAKVLFGKSSQAVDCVDINNEDGTHLLTKLLIDKGHSNIAYVGIDSMELYVEERQSGYEKAMKESGLSIDQEQMFSIEPSSLAQDQVGKDILNKISASAIVCANDHIAFELIRCAKKLGLSVPEDLSIVGFDGLYYHDMSTPTITTVEQPVFDIGVELAKVLLNRIQNPKSDLVNETVPVKLLMGESVRDLK